MRHLKNFLMQLRASIFPLFPKRGSRACILMYHSIHEKTDYRWNVTPGDFERQMAHLKEQGCPVISLAELVRRLRAREPLGDAVALTFDDGYRDNLSNALPVLEQYGFPATVFVTTSGLGKTDKRGLARLALEELKLLAASKRVEVGSHTTSHIMLAAAGTAVQREEVTESKAFLGSLLGKAIDLFAYPYGNFSRTTVSLVRAAGYRAAVTTVPGLVTAKSDPYRLPRYAVETHMTFARFRHLIARIAP